MSKIGNLPIQIESGVQVKLDDNTVLVTGKEGQLSFTLPKTLELKLEGDKLLVKNKHHGTSGGRYEKKIKSVHGLFRQLIANAVKGVDSLWSKKLEIIGTGFNVKLQGEDLVFKIGYSHPVVFKKVPNVKFQVEGNNKVSVLGIDKQMVGQVAHLIKMLRKPDVYKGKGIRYLGEVIKLKPGKKVKAAGAAA